MRVTMRRLRLFRNILEKINVLNTMLCVNCITYKLPVFKIRPGKELVITVYTSQGRGTENKMAEIKLTYFNATGRGEISRLILAYANAK